MKKLLLFITIIPHTIFPSSWNIKVTNNTVNDYEMSYKRCAETKPADRSLVIKSKQAATATIPDRRCAISNIKLKNIKTNKETSLNFQRITSFNPKGIITMENGNPTMTWEH